MFWFCPNRTNIHFKFCLDRTFTFWFCLYESNSHILVVQTEVTFTFWFCPNRTNIHFLAPPKQTKGCSLIKTKFTSKTVSKPTAVNTVGQLSSRCYPTVNRLWANCQAGAIQLSTDCGPTVKQVLSNSQQTVGQLSSRCYPTVNRLWANCQAGAIQQSTDCGPTVKQMLSNCQQTGPTVKQVIRQSQPLTPPHRTFHWLMLLLPPRRWMLQVNSSPPPSQTPGVGTEKNTITAVSLVSCMYRHNCTHTQSVTSTQPCH